MNIYFVTPAPAQGGDICVLQDDEKTPIVSFLDQEEADDFAQLMARRFPGVQFWVMEGTATKAFITDPLPVRECTPAVGSSEMAETLPEGLNYQASPLKLNRSVSTSRYGDRAVSFIENGDPFWSWTASIISLSLADRKRLEAFSDRCRGGMVTVHYTPKDACIPQAYWGDANNPAITGTATLAAINGNTLTFNGVAVGLKLTEGDLVGFTTGDYNFIARIATDVTAVSTSVQVKIEPFLPSYIGVGSTVRFKNPVMNMRMMPNSLEIGDGFFLWHLFQLVEVPK